MQRQEKIIRKWIIFCLLLWRLQTMSTLQTQTRLSQLKNNPPCFLLGTCWGVYVRFYLSFLKHYWHNAEMPCLLSLVKQGPRATLNREYFFSGLLYWHTYSEKMLLYVLQRWRTLNPKSRQRKIQKQFKETNFEIFSYAVVLHVCCITVFCLSDLKQVINCFDQLMQFTECPHITCVTNIQRTDWIKLR